MYNRKQYLRKQYENWEYDHPGMKTLKSYLIGASLSIICAALAALAIDIFIMPTALTLEDPNAMELAMGGLGGVIQDIILIIEIILHKSIDASTVYSILYFILNLPLLLIAWFKIGRRFTILTLFDVLCTSILTSLFVCEKGNWSYKLAEIVNENGGMLARSIFGGFFMGLGSALAYKYNFSSGGIDILCFNFSSSKGNNTGRYTFSLNFIVVVSFCFLAMAKNTFDNWILNFIPLLYVVVYLIMSSVVIDIIHNRNKKSELKIITSNPDLSDYLLARVAHGATVVLGKGAFSSNDKYIVTMAVSANEVNKIISIIKDVDPSAFIEVFDLYKVVGGFYLRPIK